MYLMVEFPRVKTGEKEYSIVYYEKVGSTQYSTRVQVWKYNMYPPRAVCARWVVGGMV